MHPFLPVISLSPFFSWSFTGSRENFSPQLLEEYVEIRVSLGHGRQPRPDGTLPAGSSWPSAAVLVHLERFWPCYSSLHLPSCPGAPVGSLRALLAAASSSSCADQGFFLHRCMHPFLLCLCFCQSWQYFRTYPMACDMLTFFGGQRA